MERVGKRRAVSPELRPAPPYPLGRRVRDMTLLCLLFGAVAGAATAPRGGAVALISGALAGMIILPPLGAVLGLLGGRPKDTLFGGLCGLAIGALAAAVAGEADMLGRANLTLIEGIIVGATFPALARRVRAAVGSRWWPPINCPAP